MNQLENHGVMFHHFHSQELQKQIPGSITNEAFEQIIRKLMKNICDPLEWLYNYKENSLTQGQICLTFDDALLCQIEIALPILNKYKVKAFWFVYSSVLEDEIENLEIYRYFRSKFFENFNSFFIEFKRMADGYISLPSLTDLSLKITEKRNDYTFYSPEEAYFRILRDEYITNNLYDKIMHTMIKSKKVNIRSIAEEIWMKKENVHNLHKSGHIVGLHGYNHPTSMKSLSYDDQKSQYERNFNSLAKITGENPFCMSHPNNSFTESTLLILKDLGIKFGFCSNLRGKVSDLTLPRIDHTDLLRQLKIN